MIKSVASPRSSRDSQGDSEQARCLRVRSSCMPAVQAKETVLRWQCSRRDVSTSKASEEGEDCQTGELVRGTSYDGHTVLLVSAIPPRRL